MVPLQWLYRDMEKKMETTIVMMTLYPGLYALRLSECPV